ncbi:DNA polymerase III subunit gamma/tau [Treponema sp. Marseille-Q4130]|uniref:DNA polymerase III subunit gamma/tau n=1 Tax=Treponema sp. Marseille-Q4130 TaxID=2766702 RepID=UPI001651BAB7|nr:DNA polymerase III subunit gamma/tau [Treponema sp. Marseille-Q4130]MBC6720950.1 DNA polymerase III subunit gamma/tau [Treponema sp. Marseille-Q4130]
MAYEVTATRRRPQQFSDLVGQEFVAETLKNSITSHQIAHAYLFSGPRGCGKTSTARILAKALNCENGPTPAPCGTCAHCTEITKGASLDVIEIDGASNTSVNDVRQIKDEVMFPPNSSRYKIYIIDEVHMLSTSAFNALLKTIEEPPPYVVFIFATTELQKVPATIKSRCQQFNFRLVSAEKIKDLLADAVRELSIQADDEALYWIAREATGSIRDAYTLFDQVAAFSDGVITYDKIRDKLGLVGVDRLNELFEKCAAGKADDAIGVLDAYLESGISIEQLIANSTNYIRSLLLIKNGITKESLLGSSAERYSSAVIEAWNTVQVERALSIFLQLYRDIRYSLSPRYELELAFSRLCWLSEYVSPAEVKSAIDSARALLTAGHPAHSVQDAGHAAQNDAAAGRVAHQSIESNAANAQSAGQSSGTDAAAGRAARQSIGGNAAYTQTASPLVPDGIAGENGGSSQSTAQNAFAPSAQTDPTVEQPQSATRNAFTPSAQSRVSAELPKAMPRFSALAEKPPENESPFYNGGAVPPEQAAAKGDERAAMPSEMQPPFQSAPSWGDDFSSDDFDDSDEALSDEDGDDRGDEDASNSSEVRAYIPPLRVEHTGEAADEAEAYVTGGGRTITIAQLRGSVIAELGIHDAPTAAALMTTTPWQISGDAISTQAATAYQKAQLERQRDAILRTLEKVCERRMDFSVGLKEAESAAGPAEVPQQVKILCSLFKGSIVGGKI